MKIKQTAGRASLGEFAPEFAKVNDDILFGEVWSGGGLTPKTRSILTVTALISKGIIDSSFEHHLKFAKENGVTRAEMAELITHVAFYAGWPNAWAAFRMAKEIYRSYGDQADRKPCRNRNVVVTYTLAGEEAIVTAAFTSDSATISDVETSNVRGDVNARVAVGPHQFVWPAREAFPQTVLANLKVRLTAWSVGQPPDYVAFDLSGKEAPRYYVSSNAVPGGVLARTYKTDKLLMRRIPASGVMAELGDVTGAATSSAPMHSVSFSDDYYIGVFTLTAGSPAARPRKNSARPCGH